MSPPRRVYVVAAEPSGDAFAAELIDALRALRGDLAFAGVGGAGMAERGIISAIDIAPLSVLGLIEGLKAYGDVVRAADATCADILAFRPDIVLLVDSWGFTLRVAQRVRAAAPTVRLVKVIGPQVWATRPRRAVTLAATVDHVLCIHPFELPFYEGLPVRTTVIGNPALGRHEPGDGTAFRRAHKLSANDRVVLILPGSRPSELRRVAPILLQAADRLQRADPATRFVIAPSDEMVSRLPEDLASRFPGVVILRDEAAKVDAMAACDLALACSGTVATEAALQRRPVIVAYKLGWITWAIARAFLYKSPFINLLNVAAGRMIVPEFLQTRCRADLIAAASARLLDDPHAREAQVRAQDAALAVMGAGEAPAARRAAEAVLSELEALAG